MALSFPGLYEPGFIGLCNPMGIARGYGIISYKKVNILKTTKGQHAKRFPLWNTIANHGAQYPIMVHNIQTPALKQTRLPYIKILRICRHSRQSVVSNPSACRIVESRIHYVKQKEWQECDTPCFFIKRLYAVSTPGKSPRDFPGSCCT